MSLLAHEEVVVQPGRAQRHLRRDRDPLDRARPGARRRCACGATRALGDAIADALRLSEAMTYKAAAAGLDLGGGKAVLCVPPERELHAGAAAGSDARHRRHRRVPGRPLRDGGGRRDRHGRHVDHQGAHRARRRAFPLTPAGPGIQVRSRHAASRRRSERAAEHRYGSADLAGRRVTDRGWATSALALAERLAADGAELGVSDIDPGKRELAERLGARWLDPGDAVTAECERPGALRTRRRDRRRKRRAAALRDRLRRGEQRARRALAGGASAEREILYAPDFIANAGGLINVYGELHPSTESGWTRWWTGSERRSAGSSRQRRSARSPRSRPRRPSPRSGSTRGRRVGVRLRCLGSGRWTARS